MFTKRAEDCAHPNPPGVLQAALVSVEFSIESLGMLLEPLQTAIDFNFRIRIN